MYTVALQVWLSPASSKVVPVLLSFVKKISSVRIYIPADLRPADNRHSVSQSVQVGHIAITPVVMPYTCRCAHTYMQMHHTCTCTCNTHASAYVPMVCDYVAIIITEWLFATSLLCSGGSEKIPGWPPSARPSARYEYQRWWLQEHY